MGLLAFIRKLLGASEPHSPAGADQQPECTTAVLEPPADDQPAWEMEGPPWWIPPDEATPTTPRADANHEPVDEDLHRQLVGTLDDANLELPRLSEVTQQLLLMLHDEDVDLKRVAEVAGRDPALTATVLRLANSVAYRGVCHVRQLDQALVRLGRRTTRSLVLTQSVKGTAIQTGGPERTLGEELWRRSLGSAIVLSHLADHCKLAEDEAFLVGLLHDVGMLGVLKVVHGFTQSTGRGVPRSIFDALCGEWHEHLGLRLADAWNLPDPLPELVGKHHQDPADDDPLKTYRLLIMLADAACPMIGCAPPQSRDFLNLPCVRRLGLGDDEETYCLLAPLPRLVSEQVDVF